MSTAKAFPMTTTAYHQHQLMSFCRSEFIPTRTGYDQKRRNKFRPTKPIHLLSIFLMGLSSTAWSAQPDAGSVLRDETRRENTATPVMPPKVDAATDSKATTDVGPKTTVSGFRLVGLSAVPESEAQAFLSEFTAAPLSLEGLHRVAEKFEDWLRKRGLFAARAYVPPQDIKDGVVEIRVLEGQVEGIDIKRAPSTRVSDEMLQGMMAKALPLGGALEQAKLERGLLLMNDLPATSARAVLAPGKALGGSRVVVEAAQGPVFAGSADVSNSGNRFTGDWRLGAALSINDAYGWGDQWSLRGAKSQGSDFVRLGYTVPLGSDGWKAGFSVIDSSYKLCCDSTVTATDSNGEAAAYAIFASYPMVRTRLSNLTATVNLASRTFTNRSLGAITSDKKSETVTTSVNGDWSDMTGLSGLGAYTSYSAQWASGRVNLDGVAADRAQDAATAQAHGRFNKWNAQISHLLRMSPTAALYAGLSTQWANKNLDSSEKFVLGGAQGVRAYPSGEASGDAGWLINIEWRQEIAKDWRVVGFIDYGDIQLHHSTWANWNAANPALENRYSLAGAGATAVWTPTADSTISMTVASRIGSNPGRDANGLDSDSRKARAQFWLQASVGF